MFPSKAIKARYTDYRMIKYESIWFGFDVHVNSSISTHIVKIALTSRMNEGHTESG